MGGGVGDVEDKENNVSQVHVERLIGLLATDEGKRRQFTNDPRAFLEQMAEQGMELNECERWALSRLQPKELARFAEAIGPRLQKIDLKECGS